MRVSSSPELLAHLPIDRRSSTPLNRQLYEGFRTAILGGMLRPGQRVPSTRTLAVDLGVSRLTASTAYDQLLHEGYFEGRVGSGTYVCAAPPDDALAVTPREGPRRPHSRTRVAPGREPEGIRPFRMSLPALDAFPHELWNRIVARHLRRLSPSALAYGDPAGVGALRLAIAEHVRTARGVRCEAEQVLVTSGSQLGLRLCAEVLFRRGDRVAMEDPGYPGARAAFRLSGVETLPIPVDTEGIDVTALERKRGAIRAVYVTPSHQYPLGGSMSATRRLALLDWAARRDTWIIEDDYDSEYRYVSRPIAALHGMDAGQRVIYAGTFSKVMFPSLRIGYLILPSALWNDFIDARDAIDGFSPTLYQLALAEFIREGHFASHLRQMRAVYAKRRDALLEGLERFCGEQLSVVNADGGLHVTTRLFEGDDVAITRQMHDARLAALPLSICYAREAAMHGLLLGFGGFDERSLLAATRALAGILE